MKYPFIFFSGLCLIILGSCNSTPEKVTELIAAVPDTTIQLNINNKLLAFTANKSLELDYTDFQDMLDKFAGKPLEHYDTIQEDVTGDGRIELLTRSIKLIGTECFIYAGIFSDGELIYSDTSKINDDLAFMDWENDSLYYKLKPYSGFYVAIKNRFKLDSLDKTSPGFENWTELFLQNTSNNYLNQGLDSSLVSKKLDSTISELKSYRGKLVYNFHQWDKDVFIWNRKKNQFELFYSP
jgi:hypothetical protein